MLVQAKKSISKPVYKLSKGEHNNSLLESDYILEQYNVPQPVMAIRTTNNSDLKYIFDASNNNNHNLFQEFDASLFEILDDTIPSDWVHGYYEVPNYKVDTYAIPKIANNKYFLSELIDYKGDALRTWHKELKRLCKLHNLPAPKFSRYDFSNFEILEDGWLDHTRSLSPRDQARYENYLNPNYNEKDYQDIGLRLPKPLLRNTTSTKVIDPKTNEEVKLKKIK